MAIIRWDPWAELSAWERQLGTLFGRQENRGQGSGSAFGSSGRYRALFLHMLTSGAHKR